MTSVKSIYEYINTFAPFETAMSFDNVGILIGDKNAHGNEILVALDATKAVIDEAVRKNIRIIVTHHPVIFNPIKSLSSDSIPYLAAKYGISIISAHTNLDIAENGVNDTLALSIGVNIQKRFVEDCTLYGELDREMSCREFAESIKNSLGLKGLRFTDMGKNIKKITVSCGAGGECVFSAAKNGCDAIVTGEIKHHLINFANDNNIAVFDLGHFQSEDMIIPLLVKKLNQQFPYTKFEQAESDSDGVLYLA